MALNEYESLLSSLSLQEEAASAPHLLKFNDGRLPTWEVPPRGACGRH
jgi:hypothetical protein